MRVYLAGIMDFQIEEGPYCTVLYYAILDYTTFLLYYAILLYGTILYCFIFYLGPWVFPDSTTPGWGSMMFSLSTEPPYDGVLAVSEMWAPEGGGGGRKV